MGDLINYEEAVCEFNRQQDELDRLNNIMESSTPSPNFFQYRSSLIEDIRNMAEQLVDAGFDKNKIRNLDCLLSL